MNLSSTFNKNNYCMYGVAEDYLGCYRVFIVFGRTDAMKTIQRNDFIKSGIVIVGNIYIYEHSKDAKTLAKELNAEQGLDPVLEFKNRFDEIKARLSVKGGYNSYLQFLMDIRYTDESEAKYDVFKPKNLKLG